jgi:hypothetical protein
MNRLPTTVEYQHISRVHEQLFQTLSEDKTKVALLLVEGDVRLLIDALQGRAHEHGTNALEFAKDLETLRRSVYG